MDYRIVEDVWKRIYSEWFPSSGFEQVEGPCIEKYFWNNDKYDEYTCEVWIPVTRKKSFEVERRMCNGKT